MSFKKYNFISGLPRSGSTLLSTILNQNPRFTASISDPLHDFVKSKITAVNTNVGMKDVVPDERLLDLMRSDFDAFYKNDNEVCFNTNRAWTADTTMLKKLYPDFKMIVTIRSIPWILDSFERLHRKNPLQIKPLYDHVDWPSVYERCHMLMGNIPNHSARVKGPLDFVKQAVFSDEKEHIIFVEYEALASHPYEVMKHIYEFIGEPWFEHDFSETEASYDNYDADAKIEGLHKVRKNVELISRDSILPSDLFQMYAEQDFWKAESHPLQNCRFLYAQTK
jgi:sulfotransferase